MTKFFPLFIQVLALLVFSAGCVSTEASRGTKVQGGARKQITAPSKPSGVAVGAKILESFVANDAKSFVGHLPANLRKEFSEQNFAEARSSLEETLGKPESFTFLTRLAHPVFTVDVWKVRFLHVDTDGRTSEREALFRVITGLLDGQRIVVSFNFL